MGYNNWIMSLGPDEHEYKIGDVTYVVAARFIEPSENERPTISDRLKSFIGGNFADLTPDMNEDRIDSEYVCSAAGKEEICSRKAN